MFLRELAGVATPGSAKVTTTVTFDRITVAYLSPVHSLECCRSTSLVHKGRPAYLKNEAASGHGVYQAPNHAVDVDTAAAAQWIRRTMRIQVVHALLELSVQHARATPSKNALIEDIVNKPSYINEITRTCAAIRETVPKTETPPPPALSIKREIFDVPVASGCGNAHVAYRQGLLRHRLPS